jgi:hypothetical protein
VLLNATTTGYFSTVAALNAEILGSKLLGAPGTTYPGAANVNGIQCPEARIRSPSPLTAGR